MNPYLTEQNMDYEKIIKGFFVYFYDYKGKKGQAL